MGEKISVSYDKKSLAYTSDEVAVEFFPAVASKVERVLSEEGTAAIRSFLSSYAGAHSDDNGDIHGIMRLNVRGSRYSIIVDYIKNMDVVNINSVAPFN